MFRQTFTADGFSNAIICDGGATEYRVYHASGSGDVKLFRAPLDTDDKTDIANYREFHADTSITGSTNLEKVIRPGGCYLCIQVLNSASTPSIEVELAEIEPRYGAVQDTARQVTS